MAAKNAAAEIRLRMARVLMYDDFSNLRLRIFEG
jgi:hypothetical protein